MGGSGVDGATGDVAGAVRPPGARPGEPLGEPGVLSATGELALRPASWRDHPWASETRGRCGTTEKVQTRMHTNTYELSGYTHLFYRARLYHRRRGVQGGEGRERVAAGVALLLGRAQPHVPRVECRWRLLAHQHLHRREETYRKRRHKFRVVARGEERLPGAKMRPT